MEDQGDLLEAKTKSEVANSRDKNSKLFHQSASDRKRMRKIEIIEDEDGIWIFKEKAIIKEI